MRRLITLTIVLVIVFTFSAAVYAQGGPASEKARANERGTAVTSGPFDAHDFSGIWLLGRERTPLDRIRRL